MSDSKYFNRLMNPALKSMYLNSTSADIHFIFETEDVAIQRIPAHKKHLIAMSSVFRNMFCDASMNVNSTPEILNISKTILNVSPIGFRAFLQFFYFEVVEISHKVIEDVMVLGQKLNVPECLNVCVDFLAEHLTNKNLCQIYALAIQYNRIELMKLCEIIIGTHTKGILKSSGFLHCNQQALRHILKLDSLACTEFELFEACKLWMKQAAHKNHVNIELFRSHLGKSINDIRFELMSMDEFINIFTAYEQLFTAEKRRHLIQTIAAKEFDRNVYRSRGSSWVNEEVMECERDIDITHEPYFIDCPETTTFSTNKSLLLLGIECSTVFDYDDTFISLTDDISGELKIVEFNARGTARTIYNDDDIEIECPDDDEEDFGIWLNKPVIIKANIKYQIRLSLIFEDDYCTNIVFNSSQVHMDDGTIVTFHDETNQMEQNRGWIYGLKFNSF